MCRLLRGFYLVIYCHSFVSVIKNPSLEARDRRAPVYDDDLVVILFVRQSTVPVSAAVAAVTYNVCLCDSSAREFICEAVT